MDVGANIGTQTIYALLSGQFKRALAVEPLPANVKCLRLNALLNDLEDRIDVEASAAGAKSGTLPLSVHPSNGGGHSLQHSFEGAALVEVDIRTVDSMIEARGLQPHQFGMLWLD